MVGHQNKRSSPFTRSQRQCPALSAAWTTNTSPRTLDLQKFPYAATNEASQCDFSAEFNISCLVLTNWPYIDVSDTSCNLLRTHYEILGIPRTATAVEVSRAYRAKAKEYHPDLNKDASAQAKFVAVKEAYECLKDSSRRAAYDANLSHGERSYRPQSPPRGARPNADWQFEQEMRNWDAHAQAFRQAHRKRWEQERKQMDEAMRKAQEREALIRVLSPYFNAALVFCLVALGCTSIYIQYNSQTRSAQKFQNFSPEQDPIPPYFKSKTGSEKEADHLVAAVDPHRKYHTRWEEVNEAIQRRNDFYRALLTPDEVREARAAAPSQPDKFGVQQPQAVRL